jgi:hypothetical protein
MEIGKKMTAIVPVGAIPTPPDGAEYTIEYF